MSGSDTGPDDPAPRDATDIEAAEYVLGLLPPGEARVLAARASMEPDLAGRIASWERRLLPLVALVEPVEPPPTLWRRLALATGTSEPEPRRQPQARDRIRLWRGVAIAASALAAGLAVFIMVQPPPAAGTEVAVLTEFAGPDPVFLVRLGPDGRGMVVTTGRPDVPQGRALELWALRPGATVPESVGLLPTGGTARLPLVLPIGTRLLVSQEQAGGSPTKQPTGPVVLRGSVFGL